MESAEWQQPHPCHNGKMHSERKETWVVVFWRASKMLMISVPLPQFRSFECKAARAARIASLSSTSAEGRARKLRRRSQDCTRDQERSRVDAKACQVRSETRFPREPSVPLDRWSFLSSAPLRAGVSLLRSARRALGTCVRGEDRPRMNALHARSERRLTTFVPIAR